MLHIIYAIMELDSVLATRRSLAGDCGGSVTTSLDSILRHLRTKR
jgi:hypothetical protein